MRAKKIKTYYYVTKPGIIRGNVITTAAGFLLASTSSVDIPLFLATITGTALVIASGCVFNNYLDIDIDRKMERTKKRALVSGELAPLSAIMYATILGVVGTGLLFIYSNALTAYVGLLGLVFYVIVYGYYKRKNEYGTLVGSISGALPPVAGYVAVTNQIDSGALLLFLLLAIWQMPHFYAIGIFRASEYKAASIPILPLVKDVAVTKKHILIYISLFLVVAPFLSVLGYTGITYAFAITCVNIWWLYIAVAGISTKDSSAWAKKVFGSSLLVLLIFSFLLAINSFVP